MDEWKREEYVTLRSEIADKIKLQNDLLMFAVTTSIGVLAFLAGSDGTSWWEYLLPLFVLYPFARIISYYRDTVGKLSSYIATFIEEEIVSGEGYRPQWETLNSRLQLDRPTISEEFGTRNRYYIRKGGELLMMSVVYLAIYLYHVYREVSPLFQGPIGTDEALRIAVIAIATLFAFLVVAGIAMVRPAKMPMKKIREKYKTAWNQMRNEGLKASVEFEVVGTKREPKITNEVVDKGGRKVTRVRVDCGK